MVGPKIYVFKPGYYNYHVERWKGSRFRGEHALRRYPGGTERCIACKIVQKRGRRQLRCF